MPSLALETIPVFSCAYSDVAEIKHIPNTTKQKCFNYRFNQASTQNLEPNCMFCGQEIREPYDKFKAASHVMIRLKNDKTYYGLIRGCKQCNNAGNKQKSKTEFQNTNSSFLFMCLADTKENFFKVCPQKREKSAGEVTGGASRPVWDMKNCTCTHKKIFLYRNSKQNVILVFFECCYSRNVGGIIKALNNLVKGNIGFRKPDQRNTFCHIIA